MTKDKALEIVNNTAWKLARDIINSDEKTLHKIFGYATYEAVILNYSAQEALEKYRAFKKKVNPSFPAPKSPEFGSIELTTIDDLSPEELQELEQHIKEIKERKC